MEPGRILGKAYRVERSLGAGGVGAVFEVTQIRTGRRYALKMLLPDMALRHGARERFQREAEVLASMGHAGIVQIHDFDSEEDGTQFLVMDLLNGEDLATRLARGGSLDLPSALHLLEQVGSALSAAHARGIVHRDLKPANIFLARREGAPEQAMLLDFGLAKNVTDSVHLTATGVGVGTPLYMSPERARGAEVDARTDIYALGSILYEMLVGEAPFMGPSLTAVLAMILTEPAPRLSEHAKRPTPRLLDEVIATALAKSPEARFPTVQAFLEATRRAGGIASHDALAATALPTSSERAALPLTRQDNSARSVDLDPVSVAVLSPRPLSTIRPQPMSVGTASQPSGPAQSGDAHAAQPRTSPLIWLALGSTTSLALVLGGVLVYSLTRAPETNSPSAPIAEIEPAPTPTEVIAPPSPIAPEEHAEAPALPPANEAHAEASRGRARERTALVAEAPAPTPTAPAAAPIATPPATPSAPTESMAEQARALLATLPPEQQAAFRAQASATTRSYETQIANNERRIQQWEALIQDVLLLRRDARLVAAGDPPSACTSPLRQRLAANALSDEGMVSSTSRGLDELLDSVCTNFDDWSAPGPEFVQRFAAIGPALDHADSMLDNGTALSAPPEDRNTVRAALTAFRRIHEAQPASFARYPCGHAAIAELARAGDVGHAWCGAAADGVVRRVTTACSALRMSEQNLTQQARMMVARTEAAESNLRATIGTHRDMNETLRGSIAHQAAIAP